jgi:hypothetical protein
LFDLPSGFQPKRLSGRGRLGRRAERRDRLALPSTTTHHIHHHAALVGDDQHHGESEYSEHERFTFLNLLHTQHVILNALARTPCCVQEGEVQWEEVARSDSHCAGTRRQLAAAWWGPNKRDISMWDTRAAE